MYGEVTMLDIGLRDTFKEGLHFPFYISVIIFKNMLCVFQGYFQHVVLKLTRHSELNMNKEGQQW
jgi:hypothetical protein